MNELDASGTCIRLMDQAARPSLTPPSDLNHHQAMDESAAGRPDEAMNDSPRGICDGHDHWYPDPDDLTPAARPEAFAALPERERRVLELRLGLAGGTGQTRDEVAAALGISPVRVRQIEVKGLREFQRRALEAAFAERRGAAPVRPGPGRTR